MPKRIERIDEIRAKVKRLEIFDPDMDEGFLLAELDTLIDVGNQNRQCILEFSHKLHECSAALDEADKANGILVEYNQKITKDIEAAETRIAEIETNAQRLKRGIEILHKLWRNEYADVVMLESIAAKVYYHITDGQISKVNTCAEDIIAVADDCATKIVKEETAEIEADHQQQITKLKNELTATQDMINWKLIPRSEEDISVCDEVNTKLKAYRDELDNKEADNKRLREVLNPLESFIHFLEINNATIQILEGHIRRVAEAVKKEK